jgi:hypothetical protein
MAPLEIFSSGRYPLVTLMSEPTEQLFSAWPTRRSTVVAHRRVPVARSRRRGAARTSSTPTS